MNYQTLSNKLRYPFQSLCNIFFCLQLAFFCYFPHAEAAQKKQLLKQVRVALVYDFHSKWGTFKHVNQGLQLAADDFKTKGILLQFTHFDSGYYAVGTINAMQNVIAGKYDIVVAENRSSKAKVAADVAEKNKRVMLTPTVTAPVVTENKKYVFRTCFDDNFVGKKLAEFAIKKRCAKSAAIIIDSSQLYSVTLAKIFKRHFQALGGQILLYEKILPSARSFEKQTNIIKSLDPDIIFVPLYQFLVSRFVNQSIKTGVKRLNFLGGDGWMIKGRGPFTELVVNAKVNVNAMWVTHFEWKFTTGQRKKIYQKYLKQCDKNKIISFDSVTALGYDTGLIIAEVFRQLPIHPSQEQVVETLHKMRPIKGLTGTIYFGQSQTPQKSLFIYQLNNKQIILNSIIHPHTKLETDL